MPIITYNNGIERKVIGTLDPDKKEFSKKVTTKKHLFKVFDAWGIDHQLFTEMLLPENYTIIITDTEEHIRYKTTARNFNIYGISKHFKASRADFGAQIFLPRLHWDKEEFAAGTHKRNVKKYIPGVLQKL